MQNTLKTRRLKGSWINIILFICHAFVFITFVKLGFEVVDTVKPMPTSDFIYYWNLAGDLSIYHKGGIIGFIYAPFKAMGIEPYWSALIVNTFFYTLVFIASWLGFKKYRSPFAVIGQLLLTFGLAMFGLWNAGYAGMVNADFPNVALLIAATRGFSLYGVKRNKLWLILGGIALFLAVALRVKTGLALGIIVLMILIFHFRSVQKPTAVRWIVLVICIAVGFAAVSEVMLRRQSDRQEDVARQGRLQLYTGILDTSTGPMCGRWTRESFNKTLEELDLPLSEVIEKHLSVKSKQYLLEIVQCKLTAVLNYDEFSYRELLAFGVKHRNYTEEDLELVRHYEKLEEKWVNWFKIITYLMILTTLVLWRKLRIPMAITPFAIYFAFMALHSIFEIQARYMVEPLMWSFFAAVLLIFEVSIKRVKTSD